MERDQPARAEAHGITAVLGMLTEALAMVATRGVLQAFRAFFSLDILRSLRFVVQGPIQS
jgi:hypothetical protein